jgi:large subunit ribosomal protein L21
MFAVMKTGGKQYRVKTGDVLRVEKLLAEAGEKVQFNEVLMLGGQRPILGIPLVEGAAVQAEVIDQIRGEKVIHFVKRRRKHSSQRTKGHRQFLTVVRVTDIISTGAESSGVKAAIGMGALPSGEQRAKRAETRAKAAADLKAKQKAAKPKAKAAAKAEKPAEKPVPKAKAAKPAPKPKAAPKKAEAKKPEAKKAAPKKAEAKKAEAKKAEAKKSEAKAKAKPKAEKPKAKPAKKK